MVCIQANYALMNASNTHSMAIDAMKYVEPPPKLRGKRATNVVNFSRALFSLASRARLSGESLGTWDETHISLRALQFIGVEMLLDHLVLRLMHALLVGQHKQP